MAHDVRFLDKYQLIIDGLPIIPKRKFKVIFLHKFSLAITIYTCRYIYLLLIICIINEVDCSARACCLVALFKVYRGKSMDAYTKEDYIELAKAVSIGLPESEAMKIIEAQREIQGDNAANGEKYYWLGLKRKSPSIESTTTIRIYRTTKMLLEALKERSSEPLESVILWLLFEHRGLARLYEENIVDPVQVIKLVLEKESNEWGAFSRVNKEMKKISEKKDAEMKKMD